eukprot:g2357.t1
MSLCFKSLKSAEGLKQANEYLLANTYVFGVGPTNADTDLLKLVGSCPDAKAYPHLARWYNHVSALKCKFGQSTLTVCEASSCAAPAGGDDDEDSDDDLFGDMDDSDDDDLAAIAAASAAANKVQKVSWGRSQICFEIKPMEVETDLEKCCERVLAMNFDDNERVMANLREAQGDVNAVKDVLNKDTIIQWGEGYEIVPVAFGICKLVVSCVVVDDCLGTDDLEEAIMDLLGDDVQSVDVMSFNKASELKLPKDHPLRK